MIYLFAAGCANPCGLAPAPEMAARRANSCTRPLSARGFPPLSHSTPDDSDIRRKRIKIRAWRRGMREMDILMGRFVDATVDSLPEAELDDLEALLDAEDDVVFRWLSRAEPVPPRYDTPLFRRIAAFHTHEKPIDL
ncbi:succinate dehydrogenase flavin-adding protein (antitoxin of CptAB toxin-antitoxin module) [Methylosinus sp. sav-2]|nr:succinate dehydrogenase flavin-adding protein (antitoxin of CptAB toxin-antitoxin module) [Methylosinus sp. sav-2]